MCFCLFVYVSRKLCVVVLTWNSRYGPACLVAHPNDPFLAAWFRYLTLDR